MTDNCTVTPDVRHADLTAENEDCPSFDLDKYVAPFWEGNTVYNECVFPITGADGTLSPFELMYPAERIVSVRNYTLTETYTEGKDYALVDGKLVILPETSIKITEYGYMHPADNPENFPENKYYPRADGYGFEYWSESPELSEAQVCVTYVHGGEWDAPVPAPFAERIPRASAKLRRGEELKIVAIGDSITCGAKSSGNCGIPPYADPYIGLTVNYLAKKFCNDNITLVNSAVGGTKSDRMFDKIDSCVTDHKPDLVIIAFGMNDSSYYRVGISDDYFRTNILTLIRRIRDALPECEFVLLSSVYGNRLTFPAERYEAHAAVLERIAAEEKGVAFANPLAIEKKLLEKKDFLCFMGDNMVHPNDFGMRLIAQTLLCGFGAYDRE